MSLLRLRRLDCISAIPLHRSGILRGGGGFMAIVIGSGRINIVLSSNVDYLLIPAVGHPREL